MGSRLRDYRKQKNMTQDELAQKSGVSRKTICDLESNTKKNTTSKTLLKIANALGSTVDEIFFAPNV